MRVALTGGIASGKSTVSARLRDLGALVIDADVLAREVVEPGTPGLAAIVEAFGEDVLDDEGRLDRPRMGDRVFADPASRQRLESIVHPLVHARAAELEASAPPGVLVVHDIPLLAEGRRVRDFDAVVVVDAPEETQVQRLVRDRGLTPAQAHARIAAQAGRDDRRRLATHVIDNDGTVSELEQRVNEVYALLVAAT